MEQRITPEQIGKLRYRLESIISGLSYEQASTLLTFDDEGLRTRLIGATPIPEVGVPLPLVLRANKVSPFAMLRQDGKNPECWKFVGTWMTDKHTGMFKLVSVDEPQKNFEDLVTVLQRHGRIPEGQWAEALRMQYPQMDAGEPIAVADPAWEDPGGVPHFPYLQKGSGHLSFISRRIPPHIWRTWRWLMQIV